jgi:hypothetical protein
MVWGPKQRVWIERAGVALVAPLLIVTLPVWLLLAALVWLDIRISRALKPKRQAHQWFAWRPVDFSLFTDHNGQSAWLQTVWRGQDRWGDVVYAPTRESLESAQ